MLTLLFTACKSKQPTAVTKGSVESKKHTDKVGVSRFSQTEQMMIDNVFLEGVKQMMIEDYGTALNVFMDVLRMDSRHAPANFQISRIRLMQNRLNEAEIYAERAHQLSPQNKFYLEHLAYIYGENNKHAQALNSLEQLINIDPRNEDYRLEMANAYLFLRRPLDAIRIYDSIEKRQGISEELSMQKIRIHQTLGKDAEVRNELQRLIERFPNETKYRSILAELNMQAKRFDEAFAEYQKILSIDPEDPHIHLALADYHKARNDTMKMWEELVLAFQNPSLEIDAKVVLTAPFYAFIEQKEITYRLLDAILSIHPEEPKALALYADFLQRDDRFLEARDKYRQVIALDGSRYAVWEALLLCNLQLLDPVGLLHDGLQALERFPEQPLVSYMIGTAYNLKKDYVMAMQYLEQAAQLAQRSRPLLIQIYTNLGDVYHVLNNHSKSDENYRKALELDPENTAVLNNFAYFLSLRRERLDEAEEMARLVCQRNPTNPTYLDTFAWVLYQQGRYAEAREIMEVALLHGGNEEAVLLEHYGDILWKINERERALEYWKKAQTLDESAGSEFLGEKIRTQTLIE